MPPSQSVTSPENKGIETGPVVRVAAGGPSVTSPENKGIETEYALACFAACRVSNQP